jgi:hypothetical protein
MLFAGRKKQMMQAGNALEGYARTVERILAAIGVDPETSRLNTEQGYGWTFQRGSAVIEIYVSLQGDRGFMQVLSPIIHLPSTGLLPIYRRLLELNLQLTTAALGVHLDVVYVFSERPLEGMDADEANSIITTVSEYADQLDNMLLNEFGGRLYAQA